MKKVARVASTMPTPAHLMPAAAVFGELIAFRPKMNRTAATR